jgi:hypothetical protein
MIELHQGAERPITTLTMLDNGVPLNLAQYTFQVKVVSARNERNHITKTTHISGLNNTRPNVQIDWQPASELSTLPAGWYSFQCKATDPYTNAEYIYRDTLLLKGSL